MAGKKKFLVTADGSAESKAAVDYVARMLSPADTEVAFFHVFNRIPEAYWDFELGAEADSLSKKIKKQVDEHERSIKALMADYKKTLLDANFREENISIEIRDRVAGIARDIVAEARRGYNGLVMGCNGLGRSQGMAMGSVSTKIIGALSTIPICVVAGTPADKNMIVALDGSAGSMRALDAAVTLMNGSKGRVVLFHALRRIGYPDPATGRVAAFEDVEAVIWDDVKQMLEPTLVEAKGRLLKADFGNDQIVTTMVTGVSSRAAALVEEAEKTGCGSILVGRTGISQVEDFNIGRVANKVVHRARNQAVWIIP